MKKKKKHILKYKECGAALSYIELRQWEGLVETITSTYSLFPPHSYFIDYTPITKLS